MLDLSHFGMRFFPLLNYHEGCALRAKASSFCAGGGSSV